LLLEVVKVPFGKFPAGLKNSIQYIANLYRISLKNSERDRPCSKKEILKTAK
jgi:hypothetical protein